MTIQEVLLHHSSSIDRFDAELLIAHALGKQREFVLTHPEYKPDEASLDLIQNLFARRKNHEPIAYILGQKEFFGLDFKVTPDTLIPRPETEMMVEEALRYIQSNIPNAAASTTIMDIGTGSGNIITAIAYQLKQKETPLQNLSFFGVDISPKALAVAQYNAEHNHVSESIQFFQSDLLETLPENASRSIQNSKHLLILANLPYLSNEVYESSMSDVKDYEPKSALFSEEKGLEHYRRLLQQIANIHQTDPQKEIILFLEISPEQKESITQLILSIFPKSEVDVLQDLTRRWRLARISIRKQ